MGLTSDPPAEIMEFCFLLAGAAGDPVSYFKRPIIELEYWLKARNRHYEKIRAQKENAE
jgi:hypothetical protein